ncbi:MAG: hypothetical protein ACYC36_02490 [Bellilinea sp.]
MTTTYTVTWNIDIFDADSPREAAEKALAIHRDPSSVATVFSVEDNTTKITSVIDLEESPE